MRKIHAKPTPNFIYTEPMPFTLLLRLVGEKNHQLKTPGMPGTKLLPWKRPVFCSQQSFKTVLVMASTAQINTETKSVWEKVCFIFRFQVLNSPSLREARVGTKAAPWRRIEAEIMSIAAYWLVPRIFFSLPSYTIQDHSHRVALPWGPGNSTSIINQEKIWPAYKSVLQKYFID